MHTPGPWRNDFMPSSGFGSGYGKSQIIDADGRALAGVALIEPQQGELYGSDRSGYSKETIDEMEDNATLIAAAPDMLEALEAIDGKNILNPKGSIGLKVSAAIAKAKGVAE